jgi:hypothetical protein
MAATNGGLATGAVTERTVRHEIIVIDTNYRRYLAPPTPLNTRLFDLFLHNNAVARSGISHGTRTKLKPFETAVEVGFDRWVVASTLDNRAVGGDVVFNSEAQAREYLAAQVEIDVRNEEGMHVIPESELAA